MWPFCKQCSKVSHGYSSAAAVVASEDPEAQNSSFVKHTLYMQILLLEVCLGSQMATEGLRSGHDGQSLILLSLCIVIQRIALEG